MALLDKEGRLVLVSNRVPPPERLRAQKSVQELPVGGLVSVLSPLMEQTSVLWFGWSGRRSQQKASAKPRISTIGSSRLATIDLPSRDANLYYRVFSNRTLWPLLHNFPDRIFVSHEAHRAYKRVNRSFAESICSLLEPDDLVWVHDYHLLPLGRMLRQLGWRGKLGFFLHTPFPGADTFRVLPWASEMLEELLDYDLVGVQTSRYAHNLLDTLSIDLDGSWEGEYFVQGNESTRVGAYPVGTYPTVFQGWASDARKRPGRTLLRRINASQTILLGVDRLDYTKGVTERLLAFEYLLQRRRTLRGKISMVQISVPSREGLPEYKVEKEQVDQIVGRINGRFTEPGWTPVHFLYRSFNHRELASLYSEADVCLVTPLRDGMNLVCKEFIASRGADPGVLVLSQFCGAADALHEALIVNPWDVQATAETMYRALVMPEPEKRRRWEAMRGEVHENTAETWRERFLADLAGTGESTR